MNFVRLFKLFGVSNCTTRGFMVGEGLPQSIELLTFFLEYPF